MALKPIKGNAVGIYLGAIYVGCADGITLSVAVAEDKTNCRGDEEDDSRVNTYTPGNVDITGSLSGVVRQATLTDAATNITAENILDGTLAGTEFEFRFNIGKGVGAVRYTVPGFFTKADITGGQEGDAKFSSSMRFTALPVKTIQA